MRLSVVINTYNRPEALARCIAAFDGGGADRGGANDRADEIIVVDDGGAADLNSARNAKQSQPNFHLLSIAHAGRSAARNAGVAAATGERLLFLGDDVMLQPGCLARHRAVSDPMVAVVGPYPWLGLTGSPPFKRWAEPNPQEKIKDPQNAGFQFFATGNLSMDRAMFLKLGGFDERYKVYGWEDIDLGLRFELAGGRLIFDPEARAIHEHPNMPRAALWRREYEMGQTAWQFWSKWSPMNREKVEFMRFWDDPARLKPGPAWRRAAGDALIAMLDRSAPESSLNARLYERMIFSQRLAGVAEAWKQKRGHNASQGWKNSP